MSCISREVNRSGCKSECTSLAIEVCQSTALIRASGSIRSTRSIVSMHTSGNNGRARRKSNISIDRSPGYRISISTAKNTIGCCQPQRWRRRRKHSQTKRDRSNQHNHQNLIEYFQLSYYLNLLFSMTLLQSFAIAMPHLSTPQIFFYYFDILSPWNLSL